MFLLAFFREILYNIVINQRQNRIRRIKMGKILVAYYSWSNGNTKRIAEKVAAAVGADTIRIETAVPYEGTYDDVVKQGKDEVESGFVPEIRLLDKDGNDTSLSLDGYETVIVGTPTWWYTCAPAVAGFLKKFDWHGKKVIPFQTHGGWQGNVFSDIGTLCEGAEICLPMAVQFYSSGGDKQLTLDADVDLWIKEIVESIA